MDIPVLQYDRTVGTYVESTTGDGNPGQAKYQSGRQIRQAMGRREAQRRRVAKCVSHVSIKAAIVHTVPVP